MKVMISQPMSGMADDEILKKRLEALDALKNMGYDEVVNTFFDDESYSDENLKKAGVIQIPVYFIAESLKSMSLCDAVYFCKGWENARGCRIEHEVAKQYGLLIIYE